MAVTSHRRHDFLGNVVGLLNNSNTLVAKYVYDAWGTEASTSFDNLTVKNPLRYRGSQGYLHLYGPDACRGWSLYLAGARVYHTGVGRWLTEDPLLGNLGDPMSFNRYLYVNANPVDYSDPSGLQRYRKSPCPTTDELFSRTRTLVSSTAILIGALPGVILKNGFGVAGGAYLGNLMGNDYYEERIAPRYDDICALEKLRRDTRAMLEERYRSGKDDLIIMEEPWPEGY
jgi:RHS repeat-associated protein